MDGGLEGRGGDVFGVGIMGGGGSRGVGSWRRGLVRREGCGGRDLRGRRRWGGAGGGRR